MIRKKWFYLLIALQVLVLVGIAASYYVTSQIGERIVLETEPVDPRDLFHGDYVTLNYEISNLSMDLLKDGEEIKRKQKIYVLLQERDSVYTASSIHMEKPKASDDEAVLKGIVRWVDDYSNQLNIDYGIERFYIEEGTGETIEDDRPDQVAIRVAPWGQVTIEELLSNKE